MCLEKIEDFVMMDIAVGKQILEATQNVTS